MLTQHEIEEVAQRIGDAAHAERVVLFGSYARGNPSEQSDVDLLIVAESKLPRYKRSRVLYKLFRPYPFAMDLLVYTPEEVERAKTSVSFISTILNEGKTVYVRRNRDRQTVGG